MDHLAVGRGAAGQGARGRPRLRSRSSAARASRRRPSARHPGHLPRSTCSRWSARALSPAPFPEAGAFPDAGPFPEAGPFPDADTEPGPAARRRARTVGREHPARSGRSVPARVPLRNLLGAPAPVRPDAEPGTQARPLRRAGDRSRTPPSRGRPGCSSSRHIRHPPRPRTGSRRPALAGRARAQPTPVACRARTCRARGRHSGGPGTRRPRLPSPARRCRAPQARGT